MSWCQEQGKNNPKKSRAIWVRGIKKIKALNFSGPDLVLFISFIHQLLK